MSTERASFLRPILLVLVLALVNLTPWEHPGVTSTPPGLSFCLAGLVTLIAGVATTLLPIRERSRGLLLALGAFVTWQFLATFGTLSPAASEDSMAGWIGSAGLVVALAIGITRASDWKAVAQFLVLGGTAVGLAGLHQVATSSLPMRGTFTNHDNFGMVTTVCILLSLGLIPKSSRRWRAALFGQVLLLIACLFSSTSRAALFGLGVGLIVFVVLLGSRRRKRGKVGATVALALSPLLIGVPLMFLAGTFMPSLARIDKLVSGQDSQGVTMRKDVLSYGLITASHRPLLGSGPGTFDLAYQKYRPAQSELRHYMYVNQAHNDFVEVAVESGLVGLALWIAVLGVSLARGARFVNKSPMSAEAAGALGALTGASAYSLLNFVISVPANQFLWFAVMALCVTIPVHKPDEEPTPAWLRTGAGVALAAAGLWTLLHGIYTVESGVLLSQAASYSNRLFLEKSAQCLDQAEVLQPKRSDIHLRRAAVLQSLGLLHRNPTLVQEADEELKQAQRWDPYRQDVLRARAAFLARHNRPQEALDVANSGLTCAPYQTWLLQDKLSALLLLKRPEESLDTLFELVRRDPLFTRDLVTLLTLVEVQKPGLGASALDRQPLSDKRLVVDVGLAAAEALMASRQWKGAENLLTSIHQLDPEEGRAVVGLSKLATSSGNSEKVKPLLEAILENKEQENSQNYEAVLVSWAASESNRKKRQSRLQAYLEKHPEKSMARAALSDVLIELDDRAAAVRLIESGLEQSPEDATLLARRGRLYQLEGAPEAAADFYRHALSADPKNTEASQGLKQVTAQLGKEKSL